MIKEVYVSFEVAKLLREKGFEEICNAYYEDYGTKQSLFISNKRGSFNIGYKQHDDLALRFNTQKDNYKCSAPTQQMAMKWLREKHNLFICIEYDPPVFSAEIYKMDEVDEYGSAKRIPPIFVNKSFEMVCEAAIKECLENII